MDTTKLSLTEFNLPLSLVHNNKGIKRYKFNNIRVTIITNTIPKYCYRKLGTFSMKDIFSLLLNKVYSASTNRIYMPLYTNKVVTLVLITNCDHDFYEKKLLALFNSYFKIYKEQRR